MVDISIVIIPPAPAITGVPSRINWQISRPLSSSALAWTTAPALVTGDVLARLESRQDAQSVPTVEEVQDLVETSLIERGYARVAKAYIIYRYEHALKRLGRRSLAYSSDAIPYRKLWQALSWGVDRGCLFVSATIS